MQSACSPQPSLAMSAPTQRARGSSSRAAATSTTPGKSTPTTHSTVGTRSSRACWMVTFDPQPATSTVRDPWRAATSTHRDTTTSSCDTVNTPA